MLLDCGAVVSACPVVATEALRVKLPRFYPQRLFASRLIQS
ncbi:hypothetical protein B0G76_5892 [Paraburkholderia sp. BL23I1N1]|nr:hypothetical protein B0G76_5892 [Paraburkholderia sp. BL23I1N1]